jgi:hypothetical protein
MGSLRFRYGSWSRRRPWLRWLASSHTPQLSTSAEFWSEHAARDRRNARLLGPDGRYRSYDELLAGADPALSAELEPAVWRSKFDRAQAAIEALAARLARAEPDVVVIVGDDQHELFGAAGIPAIGLFTGESLWDLPPDAQQLARIPPDIRAAGWAAHADVPDEYPVAATLGEHLAGVLTGQEFDVTVMSGQPDGRGLGHAFTFVRRRLRLAPARAAGELAAPEFKRIQDAAVESAIALQVDAGLDVIGDGERCPGTPTPPVRTTTRTWWNCCAPRCRNSPGSAAATSSSTPRSTAR